MSPIVPLQALGFVKETTAGTFQTPTTFIPVQSMPEITTTQKVVRPEQARANRGQVVDARVGIETGVSFNMELIPEDVSRLVAGWFGTGCDTATGSGVLGYTHVMVPKNTLPSYSVEIAHDWDSQLLSRQVTGAMVDQLNLRFSPQSLITAEVQMVAIREITPATPGLPSFATPTFKDLVPFDFSQLAASYGGSGNANLMEATISLANGVQRVFTANNQLYVRRLVPTRRTVGVTAGFDFVDLAQFTDWRDQVYVKPLTLTLTGGAIPGAGANTYSAAFTIRRLRAQDQFNLQSGSDVINAQLTYSATVDSGTYTDEITSTWKTSESGALA